MRTRNNALVLLYRVECPLCGNLFYTTHSDIITNAIYICDECEYSSPLSEYPNEVYTEFRIFVEDSEIRLEEE